MNPAPASSKAPRSHPPIVVIGGGIAGLFACLELAAGGQAAALIERDRVGSGATDAAAGLLAPVHELEATETALLAAGFDSQRLHLEWIERMGWAVGLRREGALELALSGADLPYAKRRYEQLKQHGLNVAWWGPAELREGEPAVAPSVPGGIYTPDDAQLDNRALTRALVQTCRELGAEIREGEAVTAVTQAGGELLVHLGEQSIAASGVIVATGAALPIAGVAFEPVTPVRGQMVSVSPPPGGLITRPMRLQSRSWGYGYLVPKADRIILGSTHEEMGHDRRLTAGGVMDILRRAYTAVPGIFDLPIQELWAGLRPATAARVPSLRRHPEWPLVWVNGLYRHGILLGPLLARAAVRLLEGHELPPTVAALQAEAPHPPVAL